MVPLSAVRLCERIFRRKNGTLFCLAGLLHIHVIVGIGCRHWLFHICIVHPRRRYPKVCIFLNVFFSILFGFICHFLKSQEICTESANLTMCPLCDQSCDYWSLSESCLHTKITYLFDNSATVIFAIFMSFWGELTVKIEVLKTN